MGPLSLQLQHKLTSHENRLTKPNIKMSKGTSTEAIFIPIDLEASLGKIEDIPMNDCDDMDCEPIARTSNNPFNEEKVNKDHHVIFPYPYSQTVDEITERKKLTESVGSNWSLAGQADASGKQSPFIGDDFEIIPNDCDDDFSISSEAAGSMNEEDLELERIEDPATFWESGAEATAGQPTIIPFSVSFSYADDSTLI